MRGKKRGEEGGNAFERPTNDRAKEGEEKEGRVLMPPSARRRFPASFAQHARPFPGKRKKSEKGSSFVRGAFWHFWLILFAKRKRTDREN